MDGLQKLVLIQAGWVLLGTAVLAFSLWLAIRIINRRERWAKRTAVAIALIVVLYPISLGPATTLWSYRGEPRSWEDTFFVVYFPIQMAMWNLHVGKPLNDWYLDPCQSLGRRLNGNFKSPVKPSS